MSSQKPKTTSVSSAVTGCLWSVLSCLLVLSLTLAVPAQETPAPTDTGQYEATTAASADPAGPGCAHLPAAGGRVWERLAIGDPYAFLDEVEVDPDRTPALALVVNGWASPSDGRLPGVRPSRHPDRMRVRSVVVVTPDGRQMTALRRRGAGAEPWLDGSGDGPMMRALQWVWWRHPAA